MGKYLADSYDAALRENADLKARLVEAEALLREANAELRWWIDEHVCCDGHQGRLLNRIDAFLTPVNLEPAPDGSRVLCVADQPPGVACPECGSVDPVDKDGHSAGCSRQAEQ